MKVERWEEQSVGQARGVMGAEEGTVKGGLCRDGQQEPSHTSRRTERASIMIQSRGAAAETAQT